MLRATKVLQKITANAGARQILLQAKNASTASTIQQRSSADLDASMSWIDMPWPSSRIGSVPRVTRSFLPDQWIDMPWPSSRHLHTCTSTNIDASENMEGWLYEPWPSSRLFNKPQSDCSNDNGCMTANEEVAAEAKNIQRRNSLRSTIDYELGLDWPSSRTEHSHSIGVGPDGDTSGLVRRRKVSHFSLVDERISRRFAGERAPAVAEVE